MVLRHKKVVYQDSKKVTHQKLVEIHKNEFYQIFDLGLKR